MKVLLKTRQRIWHEAGEIVEVSPASAQFLLSIGAAEVLPAKAETPEKAPKRTTRKKG